MISSWIPHFQFHNKRLHFCVFWRQFGLVIRLFCWPGRMFAFLSIFRVCVPFFVGFMNSAHCRLFVFWASYETFGLFWNFVIACAFKDCFYIYISVFVMLTKNRDKELFLQRPKIGWQHSALAYCVYTRIVSQFGRRLEKWRMLLVP